MSRTMHPSYVRQLSKRLGADDDFYRAVLARVHDNIPRLQFGVVYRAEDIFGWEYWEALPDHWWRRFLGEVLTHPVVDRKLPLRFASCPHGTIKRYVRC